MLRVLDLFSGIGGFSLGLERAGMKTVAFCEIEPFCHKVLRKHWPDVPVYGDIRTLTADRLRDDGIGTIDVICGGFPCQPFSGAGRKLGTEDNRDLWPEMFRVIQEFKPTWVIGENVAGFVNMELERSVLNLESAGYQVQPVIIPACAIGAPHRRDRVWIVAYSESIGRNRRESQYRECSKPQGTRNANEFPGTSYFSNSRVNADTNRQRCKKQYVAVKPAQPGFSSGDFTSIWSQWQTESPVCRGDNGIPYRMDRIKALGNAVVPQIPEIIGKAIIESMRAAV